MWWLVLGLLLASSRRSAWRSPDWSPTSDGERIRTLPPADSGACAAWEALAAAAAVKPDGTPITDDDAAQLLWAPRALIPREIRDAVDRWASEIGPPPAGCGSTWATRWHLWTGGG